MRFSKWGGETVARYSFLGCDLFWSVAMEGASRLPVPAEPPQHVKRFRSVPVANLTVHGRRRRYFGYDMVRTIEDIPDTGRMTSAPTMLS
jgi:hypothetical protein